MSKQMTIRDIAGFCPEEAIWKMIADVSGCLTSGGHEKALSPDSVMIDGSSFMISHCQGEVGEFLAPEHKKGQTADEKELVWVLGAIAYYAATGHIVFGGHGGSYQKDHPSVSLPVLPKGLQTLTPVLQKCLCVMPDERIGLQGLHELAQRGLSECSKQIRKKVSPTNKDEKKVKYTGEKWPEEMIEV